MEQQNREYLVYKHTTPSGKVYIGITCKNLNTGGTMVKGIKIAESFIMLFKNMGGTLLNTRCYLTISQKLMRSKKKLS